MSDDWVMVPRKLTIGMIAAGWAAFRRDKPPVQLLGPGKGFCEAWEAMLAAAPARPSPEHPSQDGGAA